MKYENLIQRSDREFKRLTGVTPVLFHEILQVTTEAESRKIELGRPHTLSLADQLLLTLSYSTAFPKATSAAPSVKPRMPSSVSNASPCQSTRIRPTKRSLLTLLKAQLNVPKKQQQYYSGKKKWHTVKIQVVA